MITGVSLDDIWSLMITQVSSPDINWSLTTSGQNSKSYIYLYLRMCKEILEQKIESDKFVYSSEGLFCIYFVLDK